MKIPVRWLVWLLTAVCVLLSAWFIWQGDITFSSDIARDFLLFGEIDQKKIVLIGPRSSTGLFHGPLWLYLNYPAYLAGQGNPVVVGWWWVLLSVFFAYTCYRVAAGLFGRESGYLMLLMTSLYMVFHSRGLFNPHGAMFLLPGFFYTFIRYAERRTLRYLVCHVLLAGGLIQFQMAVGLPFFILSVAALGYLILRDGPRRHIAALALIVLPLGNFILFDLRHGFLLSKLVADFVRPDSGGTAFNYAGLIGDRLKMAFSSPELLRVDQGGRNLVLMGVLFWLVWIQLRDHRFRLYYLSFLYFYFGFFVLSFINKGNLLYFYLFPVFPLVFLIWSSFITSRYRRPFAVLFALIFSLNLYTAGTDVRTSAATAAGHAESWKFLGGMASAVTAGPDREFGYFVYSPDAFGYQPKYALQYAVRHAGKPISYFRKLPVTYVISAPPPRDNPYMRSDWWRTEQLHLTGKPERTVRYDNGYTVERFELTAADQEIPFDPSIDPGLHFR